MTRRPPPGQAGILWRRVVLLLTLTLAGCGYKDAPIPPQHAVPSAVTDLKVELDAQGAVLSWSYPRSTVTGEDLEEIGSFILYRAEIPESSYCETCPVPYSSTISIPGGTVPQDRGKTQVFEATGLRPGNLYFFKLRSKTSWWHTSQDSNQVSFYWQTPPTAPQNLAAVAGDGENTLQWQPVDRPQDGAAPPAQVRYQLHRSVDGAEFSPLGAPQAATRYQDAPVENGKTYAYTVQAISTYPRGSVNSALSAPVLAEPHDRTSPPVPREVAGVRTELGIKIYWSPVASDDLAGYRIYRHAQGKTILAGEVLLPANLFTDAQAPQGSVAYSVTSIDTQIPANESAHSATVQIEP